jgi:hypothetical protein
MGIKTFIWYLQMANSEEWEWLFIVSIFPNSQQVHCAAAAMFRRTFDILLAPFEAL